MHNVKYLIIIIVVIHAIIGCSSTNECRYTDYRAVENEPLFRIYTKNLKSGSIEFISKTEDQIGLTQFSYYIDIDKKVVTCYKSEDIILEITDKRLKGQWMTADMFRHNEKNKKRQAYWLCFSDDFIEISNAEKKKILETLELLN